MPLKSIAFDQGALSAKVSDKGFKDVSLLTGGMEAEGHGLYIDEKSVETCMAAVMGRSIPSYLTHAGASTDRLGREIAVASGAYRDGMKVRAGNFNFLDAFGRHDAATRDKLVELAANYPDQLGISLVLSLDAVWVCTDGTELSADEPKPENAIRDIPSARVISVKSADLVQRPAANVSLFSKKEDAPIDEGAKGMANETIALSKHTEALSAKDAELKAISDSHTKALAEKDTLLAAKDAELKAALAAKDKELADVSKVHAAELAAKDAKIKEIEVFDMRKAGIPDPVALAAKLGELNSSVPAPGKSDQENWAIFTELSAKDEKLAAAFRAKHMQRK